MIMATEYKFPYSASEINEKLKTVDETKSSLENKADLVDGKVPLEQLPDDGAISTLQSQVNSLEQQIAQKQNFNLVTGVDSNSTDAQYPSAKLLYDIKTNFDNILQFDTTPMKNSEKLVKSGAIATVLDEKADLVDGKIPTSQLPDDIGGIETWDELKNKPLIDAEAIENSENLITSGGVYTAIQNASPNLIFDPEPTEDSSNLVNSGSLYNVIGDISSVIDSINALIGGETK